MIALESFEGIYLCREFVDFRKSINGLSAQVEELKLDPFGKYLFVFCNQRRNKLKVLYWDRTGFALWYKRLEREKFHWPKSYPGEVITWNAEKLRWLLNGIDVGRIRPHESLQYRKVS